MVAFEQKNHVQGFIKLNLIDKNWFNPIENLKIEYRVAFLRPKLNQANQHSQNHEGRINDPTLIFIII